MRPILSWSSTVLLLALAQLSACTCSPPTPVPITLRVVNDSRSPIYIDGSRGKLGLTVQREVGGTLYGFDDLADPCTLCSNVCTALACLDAGTPQVRRLAPGERLERTWSGVVQVSGVPPCGTQRSCANPQNAPIDESFDLKLCYSFQQPLGMSFDDAGVGEGPLPAVSTSCTDKRFAIQDGVVEIGPPRGSACTTGGECTGQGELCLDGSCTAGCPANDYPPAGANGLQVTLGENRDFFTTTPRPPGTVYSGTGVISDATYLGNGTLRLSLSRPPAGGAVSLQLPAGAGVALPTGVAVAVTLVDLTPSGGAPNRALVVRDGASGALLLAADMAQGAAVLQPSDLAPFGIGSGAVPLGCSLDLCGKLLYFPRTLDAGVAAVTVEPGASGQVVLPQGTYTLVSANDGAYPAGTPCAVAELRPYVLWRSAAP